MAVPEKYAHISFKPPSGVRREAEYGLKLRREYKRGGTAVGIARARDLSNGVEVSPSTVRRMKAFFDRHQSNENSPGSNRGDKEWPSNWLIANKLWGGPSGYSWAKKVVEQMNAADEKEEGRSLRPKGSTFGSGPSVVVVFGPPGSGKSTYVEKHRGENDVTFDFDSIMQSLSGKPSHHKNDNLISYCTDIRRLILDKSLRQPRVDKTWIVVTRPGDDFRDSLRDVPVQYIEMETPKEECLKRVAEDPLRQDVLEETKEVIERYFEKRSSPVSNNVERRYIGSFSSVERADPSLLGVERRADPQTGKTQTYISGYAAKFGQNSLLLGDFIERIAPTAFEIVEKREDFDGKPLETRCLFNHSPDHLLGRFPNTLRMWVDEVGLKYECLLPESRQDLAELIERGDLVGSSFSFVVADGGERWTTEDGQSVRVVTKIKSLIDVSPVTYPAYDSATVAVAKRSYQHNVIERRKNVETKKVERRQRLTRAEVVRQETAEFLSERRDCGQESDGKFGKGNTCAGASEAGAGDSAWREGAKVGAILGAGAGSIAGPAGTLAGAAAGDIGGAIDGTTGKRGPNKALEAAYKSTGTSLKKVDKAAKILGKKMTVSAGKDGSVVMKGGGVTVTIGTKSIYGKGAVATVTGLEGKSKKELDEFVKKVEASAKAAGADTVVFEMKRGQSIHSGNKNAPSRAASSFRKSGFRVFYDIQGGKERKPVFVKHDLSGKSKRSFDDLQAFIAERRDCGRDDGGRFGSGNKCQDDSEGSSPAGAEKAKYMEWKKGDHLKQGKTKKAQDFLDDAREEQLSKGGKDEGKSDDGGGVQTWSKGDDFPWTAKQVGTKSGYFQAQHPDGSKTEKYAFEEGGRDEAFNLMREEIKKKGKRSQKRAKRVADEMIEFLRGR
jgi:HK97 family phage prohead protease